MKKSLKIPMEKKISIEEAVEMIFANEKIDLIGREE